MDNLQWEKSMKKLRHDQKENDYECTFTTTYIASPGVRKRRGKTIMAFTIRNFFFLRSILGPFLQSFAYFLVPLWFSPILQVSQNTLGSQNILKVINWMLPFLNLDFDYTSVLKNRDQEKIEKTVRNLIAGVQKDWFPLWTNQIR